MATDKILVATSQKLDISPFHCNSAANHHQQPLHLKMVWNQSKNLLCGSSAYIWADWCLHFERVLSCWLMRPTTTQLAIPNQVMKSTMVCNFCCQMVPIQPIIMKDQQCQHLGIFTLAIELALQKQALSQTRQIQWWNIWILPLHLFI